MQVTTLEEEQFGSKEKKAESIEAIAARVFLKNISSEQFNVQ